MYINIILTDLTKYVADVAHRQMDGSVGIFFNNIVKNVPVILARLVYS